LGLSTTSNLTLDGKRGARLEPDLQQPLPLDPQLAGAFSITKTTQLLTSLAAARPIHHHDQQRDSASLQGEQVVDRYPAGLRYVPGSARLDGVPSEPKVAAANSCGMASTSAAPLARLSCCLPSAPVLAKASSSTARQVVDGLTGKPLSGEATARVRVVPDQTFDCTDVFGKVFNDVNRNGVQDNGEEGLPGVRVVTATGLAATTDQYGAVPHHLSQSRAE